MGRTSKDQRRRNRQAKAQQRKDHDSEYRAALGLDRDGELPKRLGTTSSSGGGRNRRGQVSGGIGESPEKRRDAASRQRARRIG